MEHHFVQVQMFCYLCRFHRAMKGSALAFFLRRNHSHHAHNKCTAPVKIEYKHRVVLKCKDKGGAKEWGDGLRQTQESHFLDSILF